MKSLDGITVAILVANGFEQVELEKPRQALEDAGATIIIVSPEKETVQGWNHQDKNAHFKVDVELDDADPSDYDALLLPGGVVNPDTLRLNDKAINFIRHFVERQKPIAAICHGPWTLINANAVKGVKMTSWPSIKIDLINAGAEWVDEPVVRDKNVVTSRKPDDIPQFNEAIVELFAK